jgi:hypothetical protein
MSRWSGVPFRQRRICLWQTPPTYPLNPLNPLTVLSTRYQNHSNFGGDRDRVPVSGRGCCSLSPAGKGKGEEELSSEGVKA